jgi:hypothetical protein
METGQTKLEKLRAKHRENMRLYRERIRNDPERLAAYQAQRRIKRKQEWAELKKDPEKYKRVHLNKLEWSRKKYNKIKQNNPELHAKNLKRKLLYRKRMIKRLGEVYRKYDCDNHKDKRRVMAEVTLDDIEKLKETFLVTLEKSAFIGITSQHLGISERRVKRWMSSDPDFAERVREVQAHTAERVGLALIAKALTDGDTTAQIFICKTLGRSLGFDEKQPTVNINVGEQAGIDISGLTLDEKDQLLQLIRKTKVESEHNVLDVE